MAKRLAFDRPLFAVTLLLLAFGLVMVFSASAVMASERYHSPYYFLIRQSIAAAIGLAALLALMQIDYRRYNHPAIVYPAQVATILLLAVVMVLPRVHGTHRWIEFGHVSLQPSELAKPAMILFVAFFLAPRVGEVNRPRTLIPIAVYLGLVAGLILAARDLGTVLALVSLVACMLIAQGMQWRYLGAAAVAGFLPLLFFIFAVPYRRARILAFLHPYRTAQTVGYQVMQSMIAVSTGGVTGLGLMKSHQKLFFLPEAHTDFIFAVICEELGLIGATALVSAFALFLVRGLRAARRAPDSFGRLLATGITAMVVVQALINFSVVIDLLPTKGIPLPLISYGGSSLISMLASIGVLLNVSQHA